MVTVFWGEYAGIPYDWIVFPVLAFTMFMIILAIFLRRKTEGPVEEDLALIVPEDEHGIIQTGQLVGNIRRTEDELLVTIPEWEDEDGNEYTAQLDMERKVPFPFIDVATKALKRLWIVLDQGDLTVISAPVLLHGLPKRWDPPYADRRKAGKFLVGRYGSSTLSNVLASKLGIAIIVGLILSGMLAGFFFTVASGHFK